MTKDKHPTHPTHPTTKRPTSSKRPTPTTRPKPPVLNKSSSARGYTPSHVVPDSDRTATEEDIDLNYHPLLQAVKYTLSMVDGDRLEYLREISPSVVKQKDK
jgi:hypothetical protein